MASLKQVGVLPDEGEAAVAVGDADHVEVGLGGAVGERLRRASASRPAQPPGAAGASWKEKSVWISGERRRVARRRRARRRRASKGTSALAKASSAVARTRASSSRTVGSPPRSQRSATVLTIIPISRSAAGSRRLASAGADLHVRRGPSSGAAGRRKAASATMKRVAPSPRRRAPAAAAASAGVEAAPHRAAVEGLARRPRPVGRAAPAAAGRGRAPPPSARAGAAPPRRGAAARSQRA